MKKCFLLASAVMMVSAAFANFNLNNPVDQNGRYIVVWNCETGDFAAANNFEAGETFTIAFDLTGTPFDASADAKIGVSRGIAAHLWFNYEKAGRTAVDRKPEVERLHQIDGNIWGCTINLAQQLESKNAGDAAVVTAAGEIVYAWGLLHKFGFNPDGSLGDEWYVDAEQINANAEDPNGPLFATLPSTGKLDATFTGADFSTPMWINDENGYAAECVMSSTAVENVETTVQGAKFIENGQLYIMSNGVKYNAVGAMVK